MSSSAADLGIWATIAEEAERESVLWSAALRPPGERDETPVFSSLAGGTYALGLESIYEGYLLHYGRPRLFAPADSDTAILLGDYLYAHGLVRVAASAEGVRNFTQCDSLLLGSLSGAHTVPYIEAKNSSSVTSAHTLEADASMSASTMIPGPSANDRDSPGPRWDVVPNRSK